MTTHLSYDPMSKEFELLMVDALSLFVQAKIADSDLRLERFLLDYFRKVKIGEHIFQRSFELISISNHNKKMFLSLFWKSYHHLAFTTESLTEPDYYNLLLFLCPDFPKSIVSAAFKTVQSPVEGRLYFSEFIYSFQICFFFSNYVEVLRSTLDFENGLLTKEDVIKVAMTVHAQLLITSSQDSMSIPPSNILPQAFANVNLFEKWENVQDCLARCDDLSNHVGILPLRATMADQDSLKLLIPNEWTRKIQPTILSLNNAHNQQSSSADSNSIDRAVLKQNISTINKLLKRPARQNKLTNQSFMASPPDSEAVSEQSSVAENGSASGSSVPNHHTRRPHYRKHLRSKLPTISSNANISAQDTNSSSKLHVSHSVPSNLSNQVIDEQSSSDDASTISSNGDN